MEDIDCLIERLLKEYSGIYPTEKQAIKDRYNDTAYHIFKTSQKPGQRLSFLSFGSRRSSVVSSYGNTPTFMRRSISSNGGLDFTVDQMGSAKFKDGFSLPSIVNEQLEDVEEHGEITKNENEHEKPSKNYDINDYDLKNHKIFIHYDMLRKPPTGLEETQNTNEFQIQNDSKNQSEIQVENDSKVLNKSQILNDSKIKNGLQICNESENLKESKNLNDSDVLNESKHKTELQICNQSVDQKLSIDIESVTHESEFISNLKEQNTYVLPKFEFENKEKIKTQEKEILTPKIYISNFKQYDNNDEQNIKTSKFHLEQNEKLKMHEKEIHSNSSTPKINLKEYENIDEQNIKTSKFYLEKNEKLKTDEKEISPKINISNLEQYEKNEQNIKTSPKMIELENSLKILELQTKHIYDKDYIMPKLENIKSEPPLKLDINNQSLPQIETSFKYDNIASNLSKNTFSKNNDKFINESELKLERTTSVNYTKPPPPTRLSLREIKKSNFVSKIPILHTKLKSLDKRIETKISKPEKKILPSLQTELSKSLEELDKTPLVIVEDGDLNPKNTENLVTLRTKHIKQNSKHNIDKVDSKTPISDKFKVDKKIRTNSFNGFKTNSEVKKQVKHRKNSEPESYDRNLQKKESVRLLKFTKSQDNFVQRPAKIHTQFQLSKGHIRSYPWEFALINDPLVEVNLDNLDENLVRNNSRLCSVM